MRWNIQIIHIHPWKDPVIITIIVKYDKILSKNVVQMEMKMIMNRQCCIFQNNSKNLIHEWAFNWITFGTIYLILLTFFSYAGVNFRPALFSLKAMRQTKKQWFTYKTRLMIIIKIEINIIRRWNKLKSINWKLSYVVASEMTIQSIDYVWENCYYGISDR